MTYKFLLASFIPLLAIGHVQDAHSFSKDIYKANPELRRIFWTRLEKWYSIQSKASGELHKEKKVFDLVSGPKASASIMLSFTEDSLQTPEIKYISHDNLNFTNELVKCQITDIGITTISERCLTGTKTWRSTDCPKQLSYRKKSFQFLVGDRCYNNGNESIVLSDYFRHDFYPEVWPKVYYSLANEFSYYPKGIIWGGNPLQVKLYYW